MGLIFFGWLILLCALASFLLTGKNGIFKQKRVGQNGVLFYIFKIRTLDKKATNAFIKYSSFLRKNKLDELPQLINVALGTMSFVGPRPDLPGYADLLEGDARKILKVKPGITGPASIIFRNEEGILEVKKNKEKFNREVIWPKKVLINIKYVEEYSFKKDIIYLYMTFFIHE